MNLAEENKPITSSEQIIEAVKRLASRGKKKMVAVAGASDVDVLGALSSAHADGILDATLFGDKNKIEEASREGRVDISHFHIVHEKDPGKATYGAVKMAAEGKADVIMKGFVSTSSLLKTVLSKDFNLRTRNLISHAAVIDIPGYHKLILMTDGGMVVRPDIEQKIQILENAILVSRALGCKPVKVALSGAVDKVYENIPRTQECRKIIDRVVSMNLPDVIVAGPLTFDAATSGEMARLKGIENPVAGDADIFLSNSIEECNIAAKSLINLADTIFAGVIVGAAVPVSLVSRTDTMTNKKASVSIACLIAEYYKTAAIGGAIR